MPKRPKTGPPYTDEPKEIYVVVTNPWGMHNNPRRRAQDDFDRVASWAQFVLQQAGLGGGRIATVECIYSMGTRDEIIVQFAAGTIVNPLLGEHRWANFVKQCSNPNDKRSTCVFVYNWRNNGDPSNHNWSENFPRKLSLDDVPAKSPYPPPSWTASPSTLTNFVLPIPRPPTTRPIPDHERNPDEKQRPFPSKGMPHSRSCVEKKTNIEPKSEDEPVAKESAPTNLFNPYEPPSQYPAHARSARRGEASRSPTLPPSPPQQIKKLDPYEMEDDALQLLRSPDSPTEDAKDMAFSNLPEASGYLPSTTLEAEVNAFLHRAIATSSSPPPQPTVKKECEDDSAGILANSGYMPSAKLEAEINAFLRQATDTASESSPVPVIKREREQEAATLPAIEPLTASSGYQPSAILEAEINAFLRHTTAQSSSRALAVKREYEEDVIAFSGRPKKVKIEEC